MVKSFIKMFNYCMSNLNKYIVSYIKYFFFGQIFSCLANYKHILTYTISISNPKI